MYRSLKRGRIVKISDTVYQLKDEFQINPVISRYVYVYLIEGKEGYYLIDSGVKGCHKKIGDYIHKIGKSRQTINAVLLTHSHPDHMGAAKAIKEQYGSLVYACEGEQNWIENIDVQFRERPIPNFYSLIEGSVDVDKVARHGDVIVLEPGITLEVINSSGHSKESLSYYYREEGVVFTGDGIPSPGDIPIFENSDHSIESLNRLQRLSGVRLYCPAWDKTYDYQEGQQVMELARQYMEELSAAVKESLKLHPDSEAETIISMVCDRMKMPLWEKEHPLFKRSALCDIQRLKHPS